jgi:hypothetical protein
MRKQEYFLTLLLILGARPGATTVQAASGSVVAWGASDSAETTEPVGLSSVTAIGLLNAALSPAHAAVHHQRLKLSNGDE